MSDENNETTIIQLDLFGTPVTSWSVERKKNANKKHEAIRTEYRKMYEEKRIRHDDVIKALADKFYMSVITIEKILCKKSS
jgi:Na+/glutamate symporter